MDSFNGREASVGEKLIQPRQIPGQETGKVSPETVDFIILANHASANDVLTCKCQCTTTHVRYLIHFVSRPSSTGTYLSCCYLSVASHFLLDYTNMLNGRDFNRNGFWKFAVILKCCE